MLKDKPKDAPIMTFCTGGIRCVKINAFLEQELGFTNTGRLQGGIISYCKEVEKVSAQNDGGQEDKNEATPLHLKRDIGSHSKFKGVNYVFDERMGARITADVLAQCETCGDPCDMFTNCKNFDCHIRFIQCSKCSSSYSGCCSKYCTSNYYKLLQIEESKRKAEEDKRSETYQRRRMLSRSKQEKFISENPAPIVSDMTETIAIKEHAVSFDAKIEAFSEYAEKVTSPEPQLLSELRNTTIAEFGPAARMISGHLQGRFLTMLTSLVRAKSILELGTFTGYSALCFAEGLQSSSGRIITCETDSRASSVAKEYFSRSNFSSMIDLRETSANDLLESLRSEGEKFDIVFVDADKKAYKSHVLSLLGALNTTDDLIGEFEKSKVVHIQKSRCLLNNGALILFDNTLWKGLVLSHDDNLARYAPLPEEYGKPDRMKKMAKFMHDFNCFVSTAILEIVEEEGSWLDGVDDVLDLASDKFKEETGVVSITDAQSAVLKTKAYLQVVLLPFRDGLTAIQLTFK